MASIFTYQEEPPRIHSPWSTPGTSTPQLLHTLEPSLNGKQQHAHGLSKLESERQDGPTEYKLHLLLRPRRKFLSISTVTSASSSQQYVLQPTSGAPRSFSDSALDRALSQPSSQARQTRLQQLTTQLLWRLQQSSPFHSSSNANLVLPVLPEATPRLGVPERPAKLLPGLEESQGALYEIGVADDGSLVGLVEDELQESLTNLGAMAASLGCTTSILRKVAVGSCEWSEVDGEDGTPQKRTDKLWVAEVLVYPDSRGSADADVPRVTLDQTINSGGSEEALELAEHASTEQLRVTLVGATCSGKSSLLGTLSTSNLDNGRGKSRLSLLKHRHEIASGITSSVAHELVGYIGASTSPVVNYASGDVSSWIDIHNLATRLVFLSDSPGLPRFAKSSFRSLISWKPSWTILCVAADENEDFAGRISGTGSTVDIHADSGSYDNVDVSLFHLDLCLRLQRPLILVITKMDLANKAGLRSVLAKLLSALKAAGRKPVMLSNSPAPQLLPEIGGVLSELQFVNEKDQSEIDRLVDSMLNDNMRVMVPILMTSAVTGLGISKLHALLRSVPIISPQPLPQPIAREFLRNESLFHVDEVFSIPPSRVYTGDTENQFTQKGIVLCGHVAQGTLCVGSIMCLGPFVVDSDAFPNQTSQQTPRASSYGAELSYPERNSGVLARSYQGETSRATTSRSPPTAIFLRVRIASLRSLRLPILRMEQGETGTIGVEPLDGQDEEAVPLERARKGMVLVDVNQHLNGFHSFSASFPASDFSQTTSPTLLLGGHAIVYVNSIRAAVKVMTVALDEDGLSAREDTMSSLAGETEVFRFDGDDEPLAGSQNGDRTLTERKEIRITFRFGSTLEWMEMGDQVLVVPTVTAPGPVAGPGIANVSGLAGFVGRVCELFT